MEATSVQKTVEKRKNTAKAISQRGSRRMWKKSEIEKILEYLRETVLSGKNIEHPNAHQYYKIMIQNTELQNCNPKSVINKVSKLKTSHDAAIKWREQSGQGVENQETIRDKMLDICEHFDILNEIYGTRISTINPYSSESINVDPEHSDNDGFELDISNIETTSCNHNGLSEQPINENETPERSTKKVDTSTKIPNDLSLAKKRKKEPSEFAVILNKRQAIQMEEISIEKEKISFKKDKLNVDREMKIQHMNLDERKFYLQEKTANAEMEFKREMLNFEREKLENAHKLELEKFKIEQQFNFELELAKLKH